MPPEKKTIKPITGRGVIGGEKYIINGIMFKFALDVGVFGGDHVQLEFQPCVYKQNLTSCLQSSPQPQKLQEMILLVSIATLQLTLMGYFTH